MKKIAILQSNYIPWKGYFDMIAAVDEFVLYDDMQFTKNDWRNRNKIKTPNGLEWLSIPVGQNINRQIREVTMPNSLWQKKHWRSLEANYRRAPYFDEVASWLEPLYMTNTYTHLSEINYCFIKAICDCLGVKTVITHSWDYPRNQGAGKTERLVELCAEAGAAEYISGPAATGYLDQRAFVERGIKLTWFDYSAYPEYPQLWGGFQHGVSILDLLFNCGCKFSPNYMKFVGRGLGTSNFTGRR